MNRPAHLVMNIKNLVSFRKKAFESGKRSLLNLRQTTFNSRKGLRYTKAKIKKLITKMKKLFRKPGIIERLRFTLRFTANGKRQI